MPRRWIPLLVIGGAIALTYTVGLGIYAVASTDAPVVTQPRTPAEARATLEALGLREAYPFESRFFEAPSGRMHYVERGAGDPLLCLHGNPTWSFLYRELIKGLDAQARVIAPDLVGFGLSEKLTRPGDYSAAGHVDDVVALIEHLDLRDLTLVVQDWGGPIGIAAAQRLPERVKGLVVMNTLGIPFPEDFAPFFLRVMRAPVAGEQLVQGLGLFNRAAIAGGIGRESRRTPEVLRAYRAVQGSWSERAGTLAFPRLLPFEPEHPARALFERADRYLREFDGRVTLIWGMRDPLLGAEVLASWRSRFPEASVLELPRAGHFLQEDEPEQIVRAIRHFLAPPTRLGALSRTSPRAPPAPPRSGGRSDP